MKQIQFPQTYDNETAHRQVKRLMMQHKQLHIQMNGEAWISSQGMTGIRYLLDEQSWHWILNYLQTGDYEDFGIFPSDISRMAADTQLTCLQELIEQKCNIARIPFFLTSSTRTPKFICEQWSDTLMPFHKHSPIDSLLTLRQCHLYCHDGPGKSEHLVHTHIYA